MKFLVFILLFISFTVAPIYVSANCVGVGTTVIFVNGVFGTEVSAKSDLKQINYEYGKKGKFGDVTFINGFNPSHVMGLDDLVVSVTQAYGGGYLDYDLTNILRQVHDDLSTQKILLVGHSQGTFYTNAAYDYLVKNGVDKNSIAVYNVATPADVVAGRGGYLTSSSDGVINSIVRKLAELGFARKPLAANIDIKIPEDKKADYEDGHSFSSVYLGLVPDKVIGDMDKELSGLQAGDSDKSECFTAPKTDTAFLIQDAGYKTIDTAITYFGESPTSPFKSPKELLAFASSLWHGSYSLGKEFILEANDVFAKLDPSVFLASLFPVNSAKEPVVANSSENNQPQSETISDTTKTNTDLSDFSGNGYSEINPAAGEDTQDLLDDIQEKLDIINQQVHELLAQQNPSIQLAVAEKDNTSQDDNNPNQDNDENNNSQNNSHGGGGTAIYSKILISEVQAAGATEDKQEFVELYNPNSQDIDLTGWYLQRKTAGSSDWSTYASSNLFSGKTIFANGYFLIARTGYYPGITDISTDNPITSDNSFALKNPNGDISDKLGFGNASDPELIATVNPAPGQSVGRKVLADGTEQDFDNNLTDFELDSPTPRSQNSACVAQPVEQAPPALKNILISEVQVSGATANDEFIELYNPNNISVDLSGFALKKKTSGGTESNLVSPAGFYGNIAPLEYFLVVPQVNDDGTKNYTGTTPPDLYYSGKDYSIASDNTVLLYDKSGVLSDKVGIGTAQDFETASVINPQSGQSVGRKVLADGTEQDTDDNSADLELQTPTPRDKNVAYSAPGQSDTIAPQVTFNIDPSQTGLNFPINFTITDPLVGTASPSGVSSYVFQWQENGGSWQADAPISVSGNPATINLARNFTGQDGDTYNFQVQATDAAGNVSDWLPATPASTKISLVQKILIDEIQAEPTEQRFVELYNPNSTDIDLTGWYLQRKKQSDISWGSFVSSTNFKNKTIKANGYFLISRQLTGSDISSNITLSDNNSLALKNPKGIIVDKVGYGLAQDFELAAAEDPPSGQSIQRRWDLVANKPQDTENNSADFQIFNAITPGAASPKYYLFNGFTFTQDTTLKKSLSPYMFESGVSVAPGVTLTIEPGTVIKFYNNYAKLTVNGTLKAVGGGSDSDKIIFTSSFDNDYGGDMSPNDTVQPVAGEWPGITFSQSSVNSDLENIILRYSGAILGDSFGAGITIDGDSPVTIKNSIIEQNQNNGIIIKDSSPIIDSVQFLNNQTTASSSNKGRGIFIEGISPEIKNCVFKDNYDAIYLGTGDSPDISEPIIQNNDFEDNYDAIFWTSSNSSPDFSGNRATGNTNNAIVFYAPIQEDMTLKPDLPYLAESVISVPQNVTLTIEPGVSMEFENNLTGMSIDGTLRAIGTADNPVLFKPYDYDPSVVQIQPGFWLGLQFTKNSVNSDLENVSIIYGGAFYPPGGFTAAIKVDQSSISLKNSVVQNNANKGVWLINSPSVIDNVKFLNNKTISNSSFAGGAYIQGGSPEVKNSYFDANQYGIYLNSWTNPDTGEVVPPTPNLHTSDLSDAQANSFGSNDTDFFDATASILPTP